MIEDAFPVEKPELLRVPWRLGQVVLGILAVLFAVALAFMVALPLSSRLGDYREAAVVWGGSHVLGAVILAVIWILGVGHYRLSIAALGIKSPSSPLPATIGLTGTVLGLSLGFTIAYGLIAEFLGIDLLSARQDFTGIFFPGLLAAFTYQAVAGVTPITEELFFRGFIFAGIGAALSLRWGIVLSAVIFSLFHFTPEAPGVMIPIFVTGMLLAWLYYRTGSLWPSIAVHAAQNAIALTVTIIGV